MLGSSIKTQLSAYAMALYTMMNENVNRIFELLSARRDLVYVNAQLLVQLLPEEHFRLIP